MTLVQYNFFSADDAITFTDSSFQTKIPGFYQHSLSLSQFRQGGSFGIGFEFIDFTFTINDLNKTADYILVLRIHN